MLYSFLYVIIYSSASVFIEKLYFSIPPLFSLIVTATIATLYFNVVNVGRLTALYKACWQEKKMWLAIMFSVLIIWCCTMIAPGLVGASLFNFIYFAWMATLGFISLGMREKNKKNIKFVWAASIVVLMSIAIFIFLGKSLAKASIFGLVLNMVGATFSFIYLKQSQIIVKRIKLSATQVLAMRFYLTIFVLCILIPKENLSHYLSAENIFKLTVLSIISLIAPLYCLQKSLEKISSEQSAIFISLSPVITAIIQFFVFNYFELKFAVIYILYFAVIFTSYFVSKNKSTRNIV